MHNIIDRRTSIRAIWTVAVGAWVWIAVLAMPASGGILLEFRPPPGPYALLLPTSRCR
jgi:hypothetical protein